VLRRACISFAWSNQAEIGIKKAMELRIRNAAA